MTVMDMIARWVLECIGLAGLCGIAAVAWIWAVEQIIKALRLDAAIIAWLYVRVRERKEKRIEELSRAVKGKE